MEENIETVNQETFDRIWKIVREIFVAERHFNDLQARYRSMASVWLLATFAAIGFVISKTISIGIDPELLVAGIAVAGCIGIALLWVLDVLVYHRLLDSCFIEGLTLEEKYTWLPPFRINMMKTQKGAGVLFRVVGFYLGPVVLLILVAGGALSLWLAREHWLAGLLCFGLSIVVAVLAGYLIVSKTANTATIEKRLAETKKSEYSTG